MRGTRAVLRETRARINMGISKEEVKEIIWDVLKEMPPVIAAITAVIILLRSCMPEV